MNFLYLLIGYLLSSNCLVNIILITLVLFIFLVYNDWNILLLMLGISMGYSKHWYKNEIIKDVCITHPASW